MKRLSPATVYVLTKDVENAFVRSYTRRGRPLKADWRQRSVVPRGAYFIIEEAFPWIRLDVKPHRAYVLHLLWQSGSFPVTSEEPLFEAIVQHLERAKRPSLIGSEVTRDLGDRGVFFDPLAAKTVDSDAMRSDDANVDATGNCQAISFGRGGITKTCRRKCTKHVAHLQLCTVHARMARQGLIAENGYVATAEERRHLLRSPRPHGIYHWYTKGERP